MNLKQFLAGITAALIAAGALSCAAPERDTVELGYVEWACATAGTNVAKAVIQERLGYDTEIISVSAAAMWTAVAAGDVDAINCAWLETTHGHYLEEVRDRVIDLGPNLEGTRIGLVVPDYVDIDSIEELKASAERFGNEIIGIDPGAGIMSATEEAIETYELDEFTLVEGSGATMAGALSDAVNNNEWVVVTGWTPHWKFGEWDLKYLEDPRGIYGGEEYIHTIVRQGLEEDMPEVYNFLDNFFWTPDDLHTVMAWNEEVGADPYETAVRWINENSDVVDQWLQ